LPGIDLKVRRFTGAEDASGMPGNTNTWCGWASLSTVSPCARIVVTYSFDVKFEGRGVCRVGDSLLHNNQNTAGGIQTGEQILPVNTVCTTCEAQQNKQTEGHPIDVATGRAFTTAKLFTCARPYTLSLFRTWLSTNNEIRGPRRLLFLLRIR
jgi:hypothetical protein